MDVMKALLHLIMCEFEPPVCFCGDQDLKNKILIKNKKVKPTAGAEESVDEGEEEEEEDDDDDGDVAEEEHQSKVKFWSPRRSEPKTKVSK